MTSLTQAERYYRNSKYEKAIGIYQNMLGVNPNDALAYQGLARCYLQLNKLEKAYDECVKAIELNQELAAPFVILGSIYIKQMQYDKAEQVIQKALLLEPKQVDAYIVLSALHFCQEQIQDGVADLKKASELDPTSWKAHYNLGVALTNQKIHPEAFREFWTAYRLFPSRVTGFPVLSGLLVGIHSVWFALIPGLLYSIALVIHSIYALPLVLFVSMYFLFCGYIFQKTKNRKLLYREILLAILFLVFYPFYVLLPIF